MMSRPAMSHYSGIALGMDLREQNFLNELEKALFNLQCHDMGVHLLFLEATDSDLLRRYALTRRTHPLEKSGLGLAHAIEEERAQLAPLRAMSDIIIDSTGFSIHDMKRAIHSHFSASGSIRHNLNVIVHSFGYKYGIPKDADYVFDMRCLPNPYFVEALKKYSGKEPEVANYIFQTVKAQDIAQKTLDYIQFLLQKIEEDGRNRVTIAFGCTGGRHRSVAMAERLADLLRNGHYQVVLEHQNLNYDVRASKHLA